MGIIIFAIHSGSMPVVNESNPELIRKELNGIQNTIRYGSGTSQMSPQLKDLISKMLVIEPKGRISLENALKHPWFMEKPVTMRTRSVEAPAKVVPLPKVRPSAVFVRPEAAVTAANAKMDSKTVITSRNKVEPKPASPAPAENSSNKNAAKPATGGNKSPGKN